MADMTVSSSGSLDFETIDEFKQSLNWGTEIIFIWNRITYGVICYAVR